MNMKLVANTVVVTSAITAEEIALLSKYEPEALVIKDEETKETLFVVATAKGTKGSLGIYGVEFNGKTRDDEGLATFSEVIDNLPDDIEKAKDAIVLKFGKGLKKLADAEPIIKDRAASVKTTIGQVADNIEVL